MQLPELDGDPRRGLGPADRGVERQLHRLDRAGDVAAQLAGIRDTGVRGGVRLQRGHAVEGRERRAVAAELELRVADDAVRRCGTGRRRLRCASDPERVGEAVPRERDPAQAGQGVDVPGVELVRAAQHGVGARVEGRVAGLAGALGVREPEQRVRLGVVGAGAGLILEPAHERDGVGRAELGAQRGRLRLVDRGRAGRARLADDAAEQRGEEQAGREDDCDENLHVEWLSRDRVEGGLAALHTNAPSRYGPPTLLWWTCS